jgi:hypothetical protein
MIAAYYESLEIHNPQPLTVSELRHYLAEWTEADADQELKIFTEWIERTQNSTEAKYVAKLFQSQLRVGVADAGIEKALINLISKIDKKHGKYHRIYLLLFWIITCGPWMPIFTWNFIRNSISLF